MVPGLKGDAEAPVPLAVEVQVLINGVPVTWRRDTNHVPPPGISEANVADILAGLRAMQLLQRQYSGVFAGNGDVMITPWSSLPYIAAVNKAIEAAGLHHEQPLQPMVPSIAASAAKFGQGAIQVTGIEPPATLDAIRLVRGATFYQTSDGPRVVFNYNGNPYTATVVGDNTATLADGQAVYFVIRHQAHNMIELTVKPVGGQWEHKAPQPADNLPTMDTAY
jgi:hypothetical protein